MGIAVSLQAQPEGAKLRAKPSSANMQEQLVFHRQELADVRYAFSSLKVIALAARGPLSQIHGEEKGAAALEASGKIFLSLSILCEPPQRFAAELAAACEPVPPLAAKSPYEELFKLASYTDTFAEAADSLTEGIRLAKTHLCSALAKIADAQPFSRELSSAILELSGAPIPSLPKFSRRLSFPLSSSSAQSHSQKQ